MDANTKQKIIREYNAGRYNEELMKTYNITKGQLYAILKEENAPLKHPCRVYRKKSKCISCGEMLPDGAVYCHMCGCKQITQREVCLQILDAFKNDVSRFPTEQEAEKYRRCVDIIITFLSD